MLSRGAKIDSPSKGGKLLWAAADAGHTETVNFLLKKGANPNFQAEYSGKTPLHDASEEGHVDVIELLVKHGARVDTQDRFGQTPLMVAAGSGHKHIVQTLLRLGADKSFKDNYGKTAYSLSLQYNNLEIAKALAEPGEQITFPKFFEIMFNEKSPPKILEGQETMKAILPLNLKKAIQSNHPNYRLPGNNDSTYDWWAHFENPDRQWSVKFPFLAIADFNGDANIDVGAILLDTQTPKEWLLVIFHGDGTGGFQPILILNSKESEGTKNYFVIQSHYISSYEPGAPPGCLYFTKFESHGTSFCWSRDSSKYVRVDPDSMHE